MAKSPSTEAVVEPIRVVSTGTDSLNGDASESMRQDDQADHDEPHDDEPEQTVAVCLPLLAILNEVIDLRSQPLVLKGACTSPRSGSDIRPDLAREVLADDWIRDHQIARAGLYGSNHLPGTAPLVREL